MGTRIALAGLALGGLGGCWTDAPAAKPAGAQPAGPPAIAISEAAIGPIDGATPATLENMRELFPGYAVRPMNDPSLEYHVYLGAEEVLYVVTNDDLSVFNVHATSGRVAVAGRAWRVGKPFTDAQLITRCECWGNNPTCYRDGEHVAVNFDRSCDGLSDVANRSAYMVLDGLAPQRIIWSPNAFGGASLDESGTDPSGTGGGSFGSGGAGSAAGDDDDDTP